MIFIKTQTQLPALDMDRNVILKEDNKPIYLPDGNWYSLNSNEAELEFYKSNGIKYLNILSIDNMFCEILDEDFIGKMDADGETVKILTKCVKIDSLVQINLGIMANDENSNVQCIDYFYKSEVNFAHDHYWGNSGTYLISVDVLEYQNSK